MLVMAAQGSAHIPSMICLCMVPIPHARANCGGCEDVMGMVRALFFTRCCSFQQGSFDNG